MVVRLFRLIMAALVLCTLCSCGRPDPDLVTSMIDPSVVMRGRELAQGLAACGYCHGQSSDPSSPLMGGQPWYDKYGQVRAPNISPSQSGVGSWTTNELVTAVRQSIGKDGQPLSPEVHRGYEWMSDQDVMALVSYLRSVEPVDHEVPRRTISFMDRNTTGFFDREVSVRGYVPPIERRFELEYGRYLTEHVARCQLCHGASAGTFIGGYYLEGGRKIQTPVGERMAPGIGNSQVDGLGAWSEDEIVHYLTSGETPDGLQVESEACPTGFYKNADVADLRAIAHFLKALPPS